MSIVWTAVCVCMRSINLDVMMVMKNAIVNWKENNMSSLHHRQDLPRDNNENFNNT